MNPDTGGGVRGQEVWRGLEEEHDENTSEESLRR